ncbi:MAG: hypothetical protein K2K82_07840 [Muribaculaceae bacterium]|nr:hypothetical protein [Muribaculaceae bacterium]
MKKIISLPFLILMALMGFTSAAVSYVEPSSSILNSGKWVKIRVESDGVYQLTDSELASLGFTNPEEVKVYGYDPTLLLTHNFNVIPADLNQLPSLFSAGKLVFYAKSNINLEPEIWRYEKYKASINQPEADYPTPAQFEHKKHVFSRGATYFLSDIAGSRLEPEDISAPQTIEENAVKFHSSVIHFEEDKNHFGVGGIVYVGDVFRSASDTFTYPFELKKVANSGLARLQFQGLDTYGGKKAPLLATVNNGVRSLEAVGAQMSIVATSATHQAIGTYRRYQQLLFPVTSAPTSYELTFSVSPEFTSFQQGALDYWTLVYSRENDLSDESQVMMCFDSKTLSKGTQFAVRNLDEGSDWRFWDVTKPLEVKQCQMVEGDNSQLVGCVKNVPSAYEASYIAAFDLNRTLPSPEIVETVANQNLHAMKTPDAVILTSGLFLDVAEELADVHRRLQGYDVRVVDQQQIFNEFGSGNISPESVRRFMAHLNRKEGGKLKALIILGGAVVDNAKSVKPFGSAVVTSQNECFDDDTYEVRSFYSDTFYGRFSNPKTSGNWGVRHVYYQVHGNDMDIAVGRIPLTSPADIRSYIKKVEDYLTDKPHVPSPGTIVVASDYEGTPGAPMHYADAEAVARPLADRFEKELTVIRPAANFYSTVNFKLGQKVLLSSLRNGVGLMLYFGHGRFDEIGSVNGDFLMPLHLAESYVSPGRYPFGFIGSCNVGRSDVNPDNVPNFLLKNKDGGFIGLVASTREVFQQENGILGLQFVKDYDAATDGTLWGDVYKRAQSKAVTAAATNRRTLLNHLCYTYIGDPLVPVYKADRKVAIHKVNDDNATLYVGASNRLEGAIMTASGELDPGFNGTIVLNIFDVPSVRRNLIAQGMTSDSEYMAQITEDFTVLKQVVGQVKNGRFSVDFNAPHPLTEGTQRIQAYAYSSDESQRALGYIAGLTSTSEHNREMIPSKGELKILSLGTDEASFDRCSSGQPVIFAEIYAPNGLSTEGLLRSSLRLSIDSRGHADAMQLVSYVGDDVYKLVYPAGTLPGGRHTVELLVKDEYGSEDYAELEFAVNNVTEVEIKAEQSAPGEITVESDLSADADARIIVETLNGELVKDLKASTLPATITGLTPGVYRVYTQHRGERFIGSSPKSVVIVND